MYHLFIFNINYFLQVKLLIFAKKRGCHVLCVQQDEGNVTVIADAVEGKKMKTAMTIRSDFCRR